MRVVGASSVRLRWTWSQDLLLASITPYDRVGGIADPNTVQ